MNYIGIDFSINYPTIGIYNETDFDFKCFLRSHDFLGKTKVAKCINFLKDYSNFEFISIPEIERNLEYSDDQTIKIIDADELTDILINEIIKYNNNETIICIEGFSYGSSGNRLLELVGYQYILRYKLNKLGYNIVILSPSTIKKHAGKGNYKKIEMVNKFLENDILSKDLMKKMNENLDVLISNNKPIKPFEDIADVFWICKSIKFKFEETK